CGKGAQIKFALSPPQMPVIQDRVSTVTGRWKSQFRFPNLSIHFTLPHRGDESVDNMVKGKFLYMAALDGYTQPNVSSTLPPPYTGKSRFEQVLSESADM
ncbi:hypothetical protein STEG23_017610, partial [Scotinomys teguina]